MPIAPYAIEQYLERKPETVITVRDKSYEWLIDFITKSTGLAPAFKTKPRIRQVEALAHVLFKKRALLYYQPRTGKTKISLDTLTHIKRLNRLRLGLIIAHAPIGIDEWLAQIPEHSDLNIVAIRSDANAFQELCNAIENQVDAVIMAWPTLQYMFSEKRFSKRLKRNKLYPFDEKIEAVSECFNFVVIDEIHKAMNKESLRALIAHPLISSCEWRIGLTGTPFGRDPYTLWTEAYLIDDGETLGANYYFFEAAFGTKKYNHFKRGKSEFVFDDKKLPILRSKLEHMVLSCELTDMHDVNVLPQSINLPLSPRQKREYTDTIMQAVQSKDPMTPRKFENIFVRLRQISSGFINDKDPDTGERTIVDFQDATKLLWLEELFADMPALKFVIFHEFTHSGERICSLLQKTKIKWGWLYGGTKPAARQEMLTGFQTGNVQTLVCNAATGGTSINLSAADYLCYFESPVPYIDRVQSEFRPLARGPRPLVQDDLICSPVERRIREYHLQGKSLVDDLVFRNAGALRGFLV